MSPLTHKKIPTLDIISQIISGHMPALEGHTFSNMDWDVLVHKARSEGVGPLLYWTLSRTEKLSLLPKAAQNFLRDSYIRTLLKNQMKFRELETLNQLFDQAEIPLVVLKGACFALTIYPNIGLRPMGDLDVLAPGSRLAEAVAIAESLGYINTIPEASPGLNDLLGHHVCLRKPGSIPSTLEIHDSLVADKSFTYAVPVDWFWEQTELLDGPSKDRFENLLMLTPTAQLLYGASHAMLQHGGNKTPLRWYYDLDQLIRVSGTRVDWDLLLSQAQKFGWGSALKAALAQSQKYFGTPVPDLVYTNLSRQVDHLDALVAKKQTRPATHILDEHQKLASLNWHGRVRLVLALLFPSPAYMRWRYQLKSSFTLLVYYPFRWWGIARDAVYTVIELLKRQSVPRT